MSPQNVIKTRICKMPENPFQPMQQGAKDSLPPIPFLIPRDPKSLQSMPPFGNLQVGIFGNGVSNSPSLLKGSKRYITALFLPLTCRHLKLRLVHLLLGKRVSMHFLTLLWSVT